MVGTALSFAGLSRNALVRVVVKLLDELPGDAPARQHRRVAGQPDCFEHRMALYDQDADRRFFFRFAVNDQTSAGVLHVVGVIYQSRPGKPMLD